MTQEGQSALIVFKRTELDKVFEGYGCRFHPCCPSHGAMLCINKEGSLYRCAECHLGFDRLNGRLVP